MKSLYIAFLAAFLMAAPAVAGEQVDLSAPDQVQAGTFTYRIAALHFDWEQGRFAITLVGSNGERKEIVYGQNTGARAMMRVLNRTDFSTKSLHRKVMERLLADGHLVGSISGAPD